MRSVCARDAPIAVIMRTASGSAALTPAIALRIMMNITRLTASATLAAIVMPNTTMKTGASAMRGMAFSALRKGATTRWAVGIRPRASPIGVPSTTATTKPSSVAFSVAQ